MAPQFSRRRPILCAVLDGRALGPRPEEMAAALLGAGVDWIQLRDRSLEADAHRRLVCALLAARDRTPNVTMNTTLNTRMNATSHAAIIVNKRVDVALATGADGVHLGFDALDVDSASSLLPAGALIGVSAHSIAEIHALSESELNEQDGSSRIYAHLAPIWDPLSKPASAPALGLDLLSRACSIGPPILAQGGIDPARASLAIAAGASGIAVTGILAQPGNPTTVVRQLREALDRQSD